MRAREVVGPCIDTRRESRPTPRRRIRRGEVVELRRPAGHSQGRRLGVLWARVIDDLRDFNVLDCGCDAVKVDHLLTKLVGEELKRRLFRIPDVEVVRPSGTSGQPATSSARAKRARACTWAEGDNVMWPWCRQRPRRACLPG